MIPAAIIVFVACIVSILAGETTYVIDAVMDRCEQVVVCPESLRGGSITYESKGSGITAYFVDKLPELSKDMNVTVDVNKTLNLGRDDYHYWSFNLVSGSKISWNMTSKNAFTFNLVRGVDNLNKFINYDEFTFIDQEHGTHTCKSLSLSISDEYFIIIEATSGKVDIEAFVSVAHSRYLVEGHEKSHCYQSCKFNVDNNLFPGGCIIVDLPCDSTQSSIETKISYLEAHNTAFYVCLAIAIVGGVGLVVAIILCVVCTVRGNKGKTGETYSSLPGSATADPVYPAGYQQPVPTATYQQPVPTATYQQPPSSYQQPGAYGAVPPAYTGVGADPTYGTASAPPAAF